MVATYYKYVSFKQQMTSAIMFSTCITVSSASTFILLSHPTTFITIKGINVECLGFLVLLKVLLVKIQFIP